MADQIINGVHIPTLEITKADLHHALAFSYRFTFGWAIFTVNEATCEFAIQSDWGDYTNRWSQSGMPEGTTFLAWLARQCSRDQDYIIRKFAGGEHHPDLASVLDEETSAKAIRDRIVEQRKDGDLDAQFARELFDGVKEIDFTGSVELFMESMPEVLNAWLEEPWAYAHTKRPARWAILEHALLPFFGERLKLHLEKTDG